MTSVTFFPEVCSSTKTHWISSGWSDIIRTPYKGFTDHIGSSVAFYHHPEMNNELQCIHDFEPQERKLTSTQEIAWGDFAK